MWVVRLDAIGKENLEDGPEEGIGERTRLISATNRAA